VNGDGYVWFDKTNTPKNIIFNAQAPCVGLEQAGRGA